MFAENRTSPVVEAAEAAARKNFGALQPVEFFDIPSDHPIAFIENIYESLVSPLATQHLPTLESVVPLIDAELLDYCFILTPIESDPVIDFRIEHFGRKVPGADQDRLKIGEIYSKTLMPIFVNERVMELTACLVLKRCRFSRSYSARPSSLNVKVFRGVFPVWNEFSKQHAVILAIAPVHAIGPRAVSKR